MSRAQRPAAGEMDQRVVLQQRAAGVDGRGQASGAWADVATVWARVRMAGVRDFAAADQQQSTLDAVLQIRWRADVQAHWRVMWRAQPYEIVGEPIDLDGARHTLELRLTKGVRHGR